jgi:hypothetical protein
MQGKLFPFIFSDDERYIISVENAKVRCFRVVSATSVTLVATLTADVDSAALPFDDDYMHEYTFAQGGDTLFICHHLFMPRMIVRTGLTSFEVRVFSFSTRLFKLPWRNNFRPIGCYRQRHYSYNKCGLLGYNG